MAVFSDISIVALILFVTIAWHIFYNNFNLFVFEYKWCFLQGSTKLHRYLNNFVNLCFLLECVIYWNLIWTLIIKFDFCYYYAYFLHLTYPLLEQSIAIFCFLMIYLIMLNFNYFVSLKVALGSLILALVTWNFNLQQYSSDPSNIQLNLNTVTSVMCWLPPRVC